MAISLIMILMHLWYNGNEYEFSGVDVFDVICQHSYNLYGDPLVLSQFSSKSLICFTKVISGRIYMTHSFL